ncbi:MAG: tRNA uridine-5-carboxymethylaminomethyl(34) synthesis enzyme MnmG, partial [Defluviitaleaceae bacterium]|nr:tRNA uridine-5-carboxymethylaminomethyl(34) synthesis enzyme MnmG [Defluviitaleaceae bacterium]
STKNLQIIEQEVIKILVDDGKAVGVVDKNGEVYHAQAVILCAGTYLDSRCLCGEDIKNTGPDGLLSSKLLLENLENLGIKMFRFKTGTPARLHKDSVDFTKMLIQEGDAEIVPFSFENTPEMIQREQIACYLTHTNKETHEIIKKNIHRSPMHLGVIEGVGARYCPSIEDKIVRFPDKDSHQVFVEPEGETADEVYISGMSTSLPRDVQEEMYRSVIGLENAKFISFGYAIEYYCIDATQLKLSLEFKDIRGLFSAGQFNGSSGYEEAAAQGIVAGINAVLYTDGREPMIIDRSEGYIGVLIDDLVTKGSQEPYRMLTSRAEYRLLLRQDNADLRLTEKGYNAGLIKEKRYTKFLDKKEKIESELKRIAKITIAPSEKLLKILKENNSQEIITGMKLAELIKRPELDYFKLGEVDENRPDLSQEIAEQVNIQIKYEGYINRQLQQVEKFKKIENKILDHNINYNEINGLRIEARQKLSEKRPQNLGQASRISGVSPADISVLMIYLESAKIHKI